MTILFDPSRSVKPTTPKTFAAGVFPRRISDNAVSDADRAWAAYELNKNSRRYNVVAPSPDFDAMAGESLAVDRLSRGLCC